MIVKAHLVQTRNSVLENSLQVLNESLGALYMYQYFLYQYSKSGICLKLFIILLLSTCSGIKKYKVS